MLVPRFPTTWLCLCVGVALAGSPSVSAAPSEGNETRQEAENSHTIELRLAGRAILARAREHQERLRRIDSLIQYHLARGHRAEVLELEGLRQREINAYEQTLKEMHRLLGSSDFERLTRAVRFVLTSQQLSSGSAASEKSRPPSREAVSSRAVAKGLSCVLNWRS